MTVPDAKINVDMYLMYTESLLTILIESLYTREAMDGQVIAFFIGLRRELDF